MSTPLDWLTRANANLALARVPKPAEALWEDLCFHAQQAAEKSINAILLARGSSFRFVHDIGELLAAVATTGIQIPDDVRKAVRLTDYAVQARYPGDYEAVTEPEYREAIALAELVLAWARRLVQPSGTPPV